MHNDVWAMVNNPDGRPGAPLRWGIFSNDFWGKGMAENTSQKSAGRSASSPSDVLVIEVASLAGGEFLSLAALSPPHLPPVQTVHAPLLRGPGAALL